MSLLEQFISVIAPHCCVVCGQAGRPICRDCAQSALLPTPSRCYRCHKATEQFQVCPSCRSNSVLKHVWVSTSYETAAKELVQLMKFQRTRAAHEDIAEYMAKNLPILPKNTVVCHIPTADKRIRQRGYDQAQLIAKQLAEIKGLEYRSSLRRVGSTRQLGASRKDRFIQANSAIRARSQVVGAHILLVDDVTTSGATLEAAAKILKKAGAKTVDAAVFAQALD